MIPRPPVSLSTLLLIALLPVSLAAQTADIHRTQYWLTAGAGVDYLTSSGTLFGESGTATTLAATVQHRALVGTTRWIRTTSGPRSSWQFGGLVGVGSPGRFPVRGSVMAGVGVTGGTDDGAALTLPVEVQLGWRLTPVLGLGAAVFTNFGGPVETAGVTFGIQLGRLR